MTKAEAMQCRALTLDDLRNMDDEMLPPQIIAKVLGCNPYWLNCEAHAGRLEFPHIMSGAKRRTLKISRRGFIAWAEGRT